MRPIGVHTCDHSQDAGVKCIGQSKRATLQEIKIVTLVQTTTSVQWLMEIVNKSAAIP